MSFMFDALEPVSDRGPRHDGPKVPDDPQEALIHDRVARCVDLALNDTGNGERFRVHFGDDLIWVPRVGWYAWDGQVWKKDPDMLEVRKVAQRLGPMIEREARFITVPADRKALVDRRAEIEADIARLSRIGKSRTEVQDLELVDLKSQAAEIAVVLASVQDRVGQRMNFAKTSGNSDRMKNATNEAGVHLARAVDDLDREPLVINTASGAMVFTVDPGGEGCSRTARVELVPHERGQLLTKIIEHPYDARAQAPLFDAFLRRIMPEERMRKFLQRWFGLCMTALVGEQKLCFFYGTGANGKSVLVDVIASILGDYAAVAKIESLTGSNRRGGGDATPDLVPLIGARFVRAAEPDEGVRWQEGLIKDLTGGEAILVRALHSDFVEVRPCFKLTISGNHKPDIRGTDEGIWRRMLLVPFDQHIPKGERDPMLAKKLLNEAPGILRWMVEGLLDYLEQGLDEPEEVLAATADFRAESDPIGQYLTDCCVVTGDSRDRMPSRTLIDGFNFWRARDGLGEWQTTTVAKRIKAEKAGKWRHPATGQMFTAQKISTTFFVGIKFADLFGREFDMAPKDSRGRPILSSPASGGMDGDY